MSPPKVFLPLLLAFSITLAAACSNDNGKNASSASSDTTTIPFDKEGQLAFVQDRDTLVLIDLEIAESDSAQKRGMMQREGFPNETSGMLFPFEEERNRSFWMANTPLSLDLFFINADSQIVRIKKYAQPNSASSIPSQAPAQYVLETGAGFADSYGIVEGDRVRWRRTD